MLTLVTYLTTLVRRSQAGRGDDSGQDLLEYALLVALVAIVAMAAMTLAGDQVDAIFARIADGF